MADVSDLLKDKIRRLDEIGGNFAQASKEVQKTLLKNALKKLDKLTRNSSGNIIPSTENLTVITDVVKSLKSTLSDKDYQSLVGGLLNEIDIQAKLNDTILEKTLGKLSNIDFANSVLSQIKDTTKLNLTEISTAQIVNGLGQYLDTAVSSGASYSEVQQYVQDYLIGAESKDGALVRYTRQIANDSFAVADSTRIRLISEDFGIKFYEWQGGLIDTSRCFCIERHGLVFHEEEIKAWGRGEISAGGMSSECGYPWAGMNLGTNENNIFSLRGGYN